MIYENILKLCECKNISIAKLEKETGLGNATIRGWATSSPTIDKIRKVADFFNVSIDELVKETHK